MNYVALFFSKSWWSRTFGCDPPGVIGAGCGIGLGEFYIGPWEELRDGYLQQATFACYAQGQHRRVAAQGDESIGVVKTGEMATATCCFP